MKTSIRVVLAGALGLLLVACGGSQESSERPPRTLSSIATSSTPIPVSAYHEVVQRVYVGYLGRPADAAGLEFWAARYQENGMPLSMAEISSSYAGNASIRGFVDAFGTSEESKVLYAGDNAAFVAAIYRNLFNRDPEPAGLAYWVDVLDRGIMTRAISALYIMSGARSTDIVIIDKKIEVARRFTLAMSSEVDQLAYSGYHATAIAREMLSRVGLDTDPATFDISGPIKTLQDQMNSPFASYLGMWTAPCEWYSRESVTVSASPQSSDTAIIRPTTEYYATENCDGPVIATWAMSAGIVAVHNGKADTAIVFSEGSPSVPAVIDLISATLPAHTVSVTGSAVTQTVIDGEAQWCIALGGGNSTCITDPGSSPAQGPENGGLYVDGNQMHLLSPAGSIFYVDATYTRK